MKAFVPYPNNEIKLRQLCRTLQDVGTINCTFEQFVHIYTQWHLCTFKGQPVSYGTATFRKDWFRSFVEYIANYEI